MLIYIGVVLLKMTTIMERNICMELFDVVDEYGNPTGETVERGLAHANGIRHRTAHIWIARDVMGKWQVLLQKRAMQGII